MRRLLGVTVALSTPLALVAALLVGAPAGAAPEERSKPVLGWRSVDVDTTQQFRGLDAVSPKVAWVGGSEGGVWTTSDGGRHWRDVSPPGAEKAKLLFRDVEASSARKAQVLAIGEGTDSRIYRTVDGGRTWTKTFVNREPKAFYDCFAMYPDGRHGLAMSDPVKGKFKIIRTSDGGRSWSAVPRKGMPKAKDGEFAFAASGTCLVTQGKRNAYLASGGTAARVFFSRDRGLTWKVRRSTIPAAAAGGVFSVDFRNRSYGLSVGGDFEKEDDGTDASSYTTDRGRTWRAGGDLGGYRSGLSFKGGATAIAVGPSGTDVTRDGGRTWHTFSTRDYDAVQCVDGTCWASGPEGAVGILVRR